MPVQILEYKIMVEILLCINIAKIDIANVPAECDIELIKTCVNESFFPISTVRSLASSLLPGKLQKKYIKHAVSVMSLKDQKIFIRDNHDTKK